MNTISDIDDSDEVVVGWAVSWFAYNQLTQILVFFQEQRKFGKNLIILLSKYLLKFQVAI